MPTPTKTWSGLGGGSLGGMSLGGGDYSQWGRRDYDLDAPADLRVENESASMLISKPEAKMDVEYTPTRNRL